MAQSQANEKLREHRTRWALNTLGPGEAMGEGDTELVLDLLPPDLAAVAFEKVHTSDE